MIPYLGTALVIGTLIAAVLWVSRGPLPGDEKHEHVDGDFR